MPLAVYFYCGYGDYFSVYLFCKITPHNEWQLIKNNNGRGVTGVQRYIVGLRYPLIQCGNVNAVSIPDYFAWGRIALVIQLLCFCWCQTLYARIKRKNY